MRALLDAKAALDAALGAHREASPWLGGHIVEARRLVVDAIRREAELRRENETLRRQLVAQTQTATRLAQSGRGDAIETSAALDAAMKEQA